MRDADVRGALHKKVLAKHASDPDTLVLNELALYQGAAQIDVAVVNGSFSGFEIKSDSDTLARLPNQVEVYSLVLDQVTLVVGGKHADKAFAIIPDWWGVNLAIEGKRRAVRFAELRSPKENPAIDARALAWTLWHQEAVDILIESGARGVRSKPRAFLVDALAKALPLDELRRQVRRRLKARTKWRFDPQRTLNDDSLPQRATS